MSLLRKCLQIIMTNQYYLYIDNRHNCIDKYYYIRPHAIILFNNYFFLEKIRLDTHNYTYTQTPTSTFICICIKQYIISTFTT